MKILMLGWEYPPMISGGLGTATEGLINGLISMGHKVTLVLPHFPYHINTPGLKIVSPENPYEVGESINNQNTLTISQNKEALCFISKTLQKISTSKNGTPLIKSYYNYNLNEHKELSQVQKETIANNLNVYHNKIIEYKKNKVNNYKKMEEFSLLDSNNILEKTYILGLLSLDILKKDSSYNIVHANDWMSFQAIKMIREKSQIPIVAHIHSTEIDRSGEINNNPKILEIEKMGLKIADIIIAVSEYTKNILVEKFNIQSEKIKVVYNANNEQHKNISKIFLTPNIEHQPEKNTVVTFVGRITFQKGPSYFVLAAEKVLKINPNVIFKVVGTGDLLPSMRQLTWELGIHKNFYFEGFLDAFGVQEVLQSSDMFVMPSVSEPFGIVALEAIAKNIPVIISKQSGVSEVLNHAMKVDFWDIDLMADRILSIIKYYSIRSEMINNSIKDLNNRTWLHSAQTLISAYSKVN